jgi:hypothetical protein
MPMDGIKIAPAFSGGKGFDRSYSVLLIESSAVRSESCG